VKVGVVAINPELSSDTWSTAIIPAPKELIGCKYYSWLKQ
jgi:hypothetical protein